MRKPGAGSGHNKLRRRHAAAVLGVMLILFSIGCNFPLLNTANASGSELNSTSLPQEVPTTAGELALSPTLASTLLSTTPSPGTEKTSTAPWAIETDSLESISYDVSQTIELTNEGAGAASRVVIWIALIQTITPYQQVNQTAISPEPNGTVTDRHGNLFAQIEFVDVPVGETRVVEISYQLIVNKIHAEVRGCIGEVIDEYLNAEQYIESDAPEIIDTASAITQNSADFCQASRKIYDYVGDEVSYSQYTAQDLGALAALTNGKGDCTEFSDLLIALNRAEGIPARFLEGVTCCTDASYNPGEIKHDWAEVYLPGSGWVPVDATWGRFPNRRNLYFAAMSPDHIVVTRGRNLDTLGGYHYYYYRYYWDNEAASINSAETWSVLRAD